LTLVLLYGRGGQPTARGPDPALQGMASGPQPLHQIVITVWPAYNGTVLYFINLPSLQLIV